MIWSITSELQVKFISFFFYVLSLSLPLFLSQTKSHSSSFSSFVSNHFGFVDKQVNETNAILKPWRKKSTIKKGRKKVEYRRTLFKVCAILCNLRQWRQWKNEKKDTTLSIPLCVCLLWLELFLFLVSDLNFDTYTGCCQIEMHPECRHYNSTVYAIQRTVALQTCIFHLIFSIRCI